MATADAEEVPPSLMARVWRVIRLPVLLLVALFVVRIAANLIGGVDWAAVWDAIRLLALWQIAALLVLVGVRAALNSYPLDRFIPGLGWWRSAQNDLAANVVATVAPPPSDVVLRIRMFRSWGIDPVNGMAGVTLNMLTFYVIRFAAPAVGLALVAFHGAETQNIASAVISSLFGIAILIALVLVLRTERLAHVLTRAASSVARRVRPSVDRDAWWAAVRDFRARMQVTAMAALPRVLLALLAMVITDGVILLCAIRFVGIGADELAWIDVLSVFLLSFPLTLFPFAGIGVLDAAIVVSLVEIGGEAVEARLVAALLVWRTATLLVPLAIGGLVLLVWSRYEVAQAITTGD